MNQTLIGTSSQETTSHSHVQLPNIHFTAHGDYQGATSVFDLSNKDEPFHIHLVLWQAAKHTANAGKPRGGAPTPTPVEDGNPGPPLTLLVQNSCFDIGYALKMGVITLYDRTEEVEVSFGETGEEMASEDGENTDALDGPWVIHHSPTEQVTGLSSTTFSPSALVTLPPHNGLARIERRITQDIAALLRPVVKPGHSYSIRFPCCDTLLVEWWSWGQREDFLANVDEQGTRSQSNLEESFDAKNLLLTLDNLPPSEKGPIKYIRTLSTRPISFGFRVAEYWAPPPVLQVKLFLVPILEGSGEDAQTGNDSNHNKSPGSTRLNVQRSHVRYTIAAKTTYPLLPPSSASSSTPSSSPSPITLKLSSSQPIVVPFSPTHRRGVRQFTSPDTLSPIYGIRPSRTNFHIIDTVTGEDLVRNTTRTHPQGHRYPREQFMTLSPEQEVMRDRIKLPYPSEFLPNGNRKPREGDPGYHAPDVRDMVPGRTYRITLREKALWWRQGTVDDLFEGIDEALLKLVRLDATGSGGGVSNHASEGEKESAAKEMRKLREKESGKMGRKVYGDLRRGLRLVCSDELIVECPLTDE